MDVEVEVSLLHANYALLTSESETPMQTIYSLSVAVKRKKNDENKEKSAQTGALSSMESRSVRPDMLISLGGRPIFPAPSHYSVCSCGPRDVENL